MIEQINEMLEEINNSTVFESIAKSYRKLYNALISEGFTSEQAMGLISSQGLSLKTS